jgi:predicted MFS family arabinose efflux permease
VATSQGWRWAFWYLTIFQGIVTVAMIFFLEETKYIPDELEEIIVPVYVPLRTSEVAKLILTIFTIALGTNLANQSPRKEA